MSVSAVDSLNVSLRATLKALAFMLSLVATTFCASAGLGLLKMLLQAMNSGTDIGIAELATHGGLTVVFFGLAASGAYAAKKCYW